MIDSKLHDCGFGVYFKGAWPYVWLAYLFALVWQCMVLASRPLGSWLRWWGAGDYSGHVSPFVPPHHLLLLLAVPDTVPSRYSCPVNADMALLLSLTPAGSF